MACRLAGHFFYPQAAFFRSGLVSPICPPPFKRPILPLYGVHCTAVAHSFKPACKRVREKAHGGGRVGFVSEFRRVCRRVFRGVHSCLALRGKLLAACLRVGILGATGNFFLVKALEYGELSVLGPVNSYKALFGMLFAFFVLGECPDVLGFCGVAVMVVGSYFVIGFGGGFKFSAAEGRAVLYRILALVFSALESVFIKEVINASSAEFGFASWAGAGMLFSLPLLLIPQRGRVSGAAFCAANLKMLLAAGACVSVMQLSTNWVFASIQVGYALALFQLSSVLSVIFGMLFFGEKHIARKLFGSALMCAGAVLIL